MKSTATLSLCSQENQGCEQYSRVKQSICILVSVFLPIMFLPPVPAEFFLLFYFIFICRFQVKFVATVVGENNEDEGSTWWEGVTSTPIVLQTPVGSTPIHLKTSPGVLQELIYSYSALYFSRSPGRSYIYSYLALDTSLSPGRSCIYTYLALDTSCSPVGSCIYSYLALGTSWSPVGSCIYSYLALGTSCCPVGSCIYSYLALGTSCWELYLYSISTLEAWWEVFLHTPFLVHTSGTLEVCQYVTYKPKTLFIYLYLFIKIYNFHRSGFL